MNEITRVLSALGRGDPQAASQLLPLVYDELRQLAAQKLANETPGQTLESTALVHEAYLWLVAGEGDQHWDSRGHFFAAAAEAMRRILVEQARRKGSLKRGGLTRRDLDEPEQLAAPAVREDLLALDEALTRLVRPCAASSSSRPAARAASSAAASPAVTSTNPRPSKRPGKASGPTCGRC
jgi:RNA polymerase sigma factor (TIGR02999 family)